ECRCSLPPEGGKRLALPCPDAAGDRDGDRPAHEPLLLGGLWRSLSDGLVGRLLLGGFRLLLHGFRLLLDGFRLERGRGVRRLVARILAEVELRRQVDRLAAVGARLHRIVVLDALEREGETTALAVD